MAEAPGSRAPMTAWRDVGRLLAEQSRHRGDRVYLESLGQGTLTFRELDGACAAAARRLADRGVGPGDRVSLLGDNSLEWVAGFLAVQRAGAALNPINPDVNAKNIGQILRDVAPRLVLASRDLPEEPRAVAEASGLPILPLDELVRPGPGPAPWSPPPPDPEAIALIDYTSGTTASPKGVLISHRAASYMARSIVERLHLTEVDRVLEYRALSWASPQVLALGPTLQAGARLVLARRFSRTRFFGWIRDHAITIAAGVPTVIQMLLAEPVPVTAAALPRLRFITSSSAPLAPGQQLEFESRYGIPVVQGCGMTEAGFIGLNPPGARRPGSIGPAVPHLDARFVDDAGRACPAGEAGELSVGGPQMATAYLGEGGALTPIPRDGFRTGDLGYRDPEGYLHLTGRRKDLIIKGGVNIAPAEITSALLSHPAVAEAATVGVPDPIYGEAIASFVVLHPGQAASLVALRTHCRARLSDFKLPATIHLVGAIPKTDRGKLAREDLLRLWRESGGASGPAR